MAFCVLSVTEIQSQCLPEFDSAYGDPVVSCGDVIPTFGACTASSNCCDGPVMVTTFTSEDGAILHDCIVSTAGGPGTDWSVWLPMLNAPSVAWNFIGATHFQQYADGTAHVWGLIQNASNATLQMEAEFWLQNGRDWSQWSALGRNYKNDLGFAGTNYVNWTYYELVPIFSRLNGVGTLAGTHLELHHQPSNYYYGFQTGAGANNRNGNEGLSGWFTYDGIYNGEEVAGHGDLNVDQNCENVVPDCGTTSWTQYCRAEDNCGNVAFSTHTITVTDNVAPVVDAFEAVISVPCADADSVYISATDACSATTITYTDIVVTPGCGGQVIRHYHVADACGNSVDVTQTINLLPEGVLEFTLFPDDLDISCDQFDALDPQVEWSVACANTQLTISENIIPGTCSSNYTVEYTYTLTDDCGGEVSQVWTVHVDDYTKPVLYDIPLGTTISCGEEVPQALPYALDNCDTEVNISLEAITVQEECGYNFIRTWTATDNCGNSQSASQTIYVSDSVDPFYTFLPSSVTITCGEPFELDMALVEDQCSSVVLTWTDVPLGDCAGSYIRLWRAYDGCGNQALESTVVTIVDTEAPSMTSFPEDITASCGEIPTVESANIEYSDNCSSVEVIYNETTTNGDCAGNYTLHRHWILTDGCGNSSNWTWNINVSDDVAPVLVGVPQDATLNCGDVISESVVIAIDNCDQEVEVSLTATTESTDCGFVFVRTWTATDACGNTTSQSQTITVEDTSPPTFTFVPASLNISCNGENNPDLQSATATDECSDVIVTFEDEFTTGGCSGGFIRHWIATDGCGNVATADQEISSNDDTPPIITNFPSDMTVSCSAVPSAESAGVTYFDNCGSVLTNFEESILPGQCANSSVIQRTWTFTDGCGNAVDSTWTIYVVDEQGPQVFGIPEDITIHCGDPIADAVVTAIDNCSAPENIMISLEATTVANDCGSIFLRTWTITDECGNITTAVQEITIIDTDAPVFTFVPQDIYVTCGEDYTLIDAEATDDCSVVNVTSEILPGNNCETGMVRLFTATDLCGNTTTAQQIIHMEDTVAPIPDEVPPSILFFDCSEFLEVDVNYVHFTDACSQVNVEFTETLYPLDCVGSYSMVYTWAASDACGNTDFESMEVYYVDGTAPSFTQLPDDLILECGETVPAGQIAASDNCSDVTIDYTDEYLGGGCGSQMVRTYTAMDGCGNYSQYLQLVTFVDQTAPVFNSVPANAQISCTQQVPGVIMPSASDNCADLVEVALNETILPGNCPNNYTVLRLFTASDFCGNTAEYTQTISVHDTQAPVFENFANELTIACTESNGVFVTATDNCSSMAISYSDEQLGTSCGGTILRTYTAADACGNSATAYQTLNLIDNEAPTFVANSLPPLSVTVSCSAVPSPDDYSLEYFDNCSNVTLALEEVQTAGDCPNSYVLDRTWTISDACGNSTTASSHIIVVDETAPLILGVPADVTIDCSDVIPSAAVFAFDNCTAEPIITLSATQEQFGCNTLFSRRWTAIDECGNVSQETQVITISDLYNPILSDYPADLQLNCGENVPTAPVITATDNCDSDVSVVFTETNDGAAGCPTITRTWCATDCVGNEECHIQTISFSNNGGIAQNGALLKVWQQSSNNAMIKVIANEGSKWAIDIYDINGKLVSPIFSGDLSNKEARLINLDISNMDNSMYFVRFTNGKTMISQGFVVIR